MRECTRCGHKRKRTVTSETFGDEPFVCNMCSGYQTPSARPNVRSSNLLRACGEAELVRLDAAMEER